MNMFVHFKIVYLYLYIGSALPIETFLFLSRYPILYFFSSLHCFLHYLIVQEKK